MTDLSDFLLARIAEDETSANALTGVQWFNHRPRFLAECEAKRRIVEREGYCEHRDQSWIHHCDGCITLTILAAVYADHPDYREEWRP